MASSLYIPLKESLVNLSHELATTRESDYSTSSAQVLPSIPKTQLEEQLRSLWITAYGDGASGQESSGSRHPEVVRSVLDLVGRDLTVSAVVNGELLEPGEDGSDEEKCRFLTEMQDRLDIILTLYEEVYAAFPDHASLEPGAIFIPLLEDLVEIISVETWRDLWSYVETRADRFTRNMLGSKGKALPLLRTINAFLRFLPRTPADLVFRGRVHQFASSVIKVADKSAINMRGDYNDLKTTWDEPELPKEDVEADGDVKMEGEEKEETKSVETGEKEPDFYSTLWSLQQYFAHPPSLDGPSIRPSPDKTPQTPFDQFKAKSDFVLPKLFEQTQKEKELMGKETDMVGKKRKRVGDDDDGGFFHPRYLTGKRLLEHELADQSFRRQILVQYFILFQFLPNLTPGTASKQAFTGGMPKTFILSGENESWVKGKISAIKEELRKMLPDGPSFEATVLSIITRERHYADWKNNQCLESIFEIPPLDPGSAAQVAQLWKKRLTPPAPYTFKVGSRSLTKLWNRGFTNIDQLKNWKRRTTAESLDEEIKRLEGDAEDDRAMGKEPTADEAAEFTERKTNLNWRALRLASHHNLRHFSALSQKRNIHLLLKAAADAVPKPTATTSTAVTPQGEEERTDDEDVEGLKRGSEEVTVEVGIEVENPPVRNGEGGHEEEIRGGEEKIGDGRGQGDEVGVKHESVENDAAVEEQGTPERIDDKAVTLEVKEDVEMAAS